MDFWFVVLISISIAALLTLLISLLFHNINPNHKLPPGPRRIPIISDLLWLRRTPTDFKTILRSLHAKLGPIVTLRIWSRPAIFVADRSLAHKALVQNGAVFADRPPPLPITKIISSNQCNIHSAFYGPKWRLLRRNLTAEILNPSRARTYSHARKWVLQILMDRIVSDSNSKSGEPIRVIEHFQFAMFCLLVLMCFGDKLSEDKIKEIEEVQRGMILNSSRFSVLNVWPNVTKFVFRKRWEELLRLCKDQEETLIPLIRARKNLSKSKEGKEEYALSYVDTLFDLELPEEKRKLSEGEMVSLCSEFLNGGTDTTSTALQWIVANLVKYPHVQEKLSREIKGVVGDGDVVVKEDDLQKMSYLKAVVLEGLRRHPPGHFVLPHAVTEDIEIDKYVIPKNATVNFTVAEMGWDPKVWEDPMGFKPERFMSSDGGEVVFDITGSKEIKMMPFGAGRRICPGFGLAMLHLEYFVANLVWNFEWKAKDGDEVDLSEKQEFTVVMKNPLEAYIAPRSK